MGRNTLASLDEARELFTRGVDLYKDALGQTDDVFRDRMLENASLILTRAEEEIRAVLNEAPLARELLRLVIDARLAALQARGKPLSFWQAIWRNNVAPLIAAIDKQYEILSAAAKGGVDGLKEGVDNLGKGGLGIGAAVVAIVILVLVLR